MMLVGVCQNLRKTLTGISRDYIKRLRVLMSLSKTSFIFACIIPFASCAGTIAPAAQEPSNREAFGSLRATIMESLLRSVFPGSQFKWEPDLDVQDDKGNFVHAEFPALTIQPQTDGSILGASGIELAGEKEKIIFEARRFRSFPTRNLPTTVVVFKAGANGNVTLAHKVDLDPSEPLIEIKSLHVSDWPSGGRPLLQVRYISHAVSRTPTRP